VPWQGGQERFGLVIPINGITEFATPIFLKFSNRKQEGTKIDQSLFQRGFMPINDSSADVVLNFSLKID
jgi:hypothetical protein